MGLPIFIAVISTVVIIIAFAAVYFDNKREAASR